VSDPPFEDLVLLDEPAPGIRRLTLNRPHKRNAMSNDLRRRLFELLREGDADKAVRVMIIRGSGAAFCAGYDLAQDQTVGMSHHGAIVDGFWARHVVKGWFEMWDYATPIIGQVHGWCLAGGTELATACDLVYVAEDAQIGYPAVRLISPPDMAWQPWLLGMRRAMEAVLTGDSMSGSEAVTAGFANRAYPEHELDQRVIDLAVRIAKIPHDILACNKRAVHRSLEVMGVRNAIDAAADIQALAMRTRSSREYMKALGEDVTAALSKRDGPFGDYRTGPTGNDAETALAAPTSS
jgi:enoyl-CoA hydratase